MVNIVESVWKVKEVGRRRLRLKPHAGGAAVKMGEALPSRELWQM